jgi:3-hydroxybutyryl-CoA dehydrogenase
MGSGIAQVSAQAGLTTIVRELSEPLCARAGAAITKSLDKAIEKGKLRPRRVPHTCVSHVHDEPRVLATCDIIIEAVVEDIETKNALWRDLHSWPGRDDLRLEHVEPHHRGDGRRAAADRLVGLHFFNPVPLMRLVEVVQTITTSTDTVDRSLEFVRRIGKQPIVARDQSGFIVNRLLIPYMLDAIRALENGVGSIADIDAGMQLGAGYPMGPFTLLDFVGLDTVQRVAEVMFDVIASSGSLPPASAASCWPATSGGSRAVGSTTIPWTHRSRAAWCEGHGATGFRGPRLGVADLQLRRYRQVSRPTSSRPSCSEGPA